MMGGETEERAGRREGDQSTDFHTDDSDGSPLCRGLKERPRPALVGGEIFILP